MHFKTAIEFVYSVFWFLVDWTLFSLFGILFAIPAGIIIFTISVMVLPFIELYEIIEDTLDKKVNGRIGHA